MAMRFLGIDIGTTSVKSCLIDENRKIVFSKSKVHEAEVATGFPDRHEQNPAVIVAAVDSLIREVDLTDVQRICFSGQMHGVVVWNANLDCVTNLVTWMDRRCTKEFLAALPRWPHSQMATGFGCATLAWLRQNDTLPARGEFRAGTIMDYVSARYAGVWNVPMSVLNAYGFGLCDGHAWIAREPFLPAIVSPHTVIGKWNNKEIMVASADLQTTLLPYCHSGVAVLNLGTSSQLCFSIDDLASYTDCNPSITLVPFFDNKWLVLAASLNGGNVIELIAKTIVNWGAQLSGGKSEHLKVDYDFIESLLSEENEEKTEIAVAVNSCFFGERHVPTSGAAVSSWTENTSLKQFIRAIASGIIENLATMMNEEMLLKHGISKLCLTGRASRGIFRKSIERLYPNLDIQVSCEEVSAAYGAAVQALIAANGSNCK